MFFKKNPSQVGKEILDLAINAVARESNLEQCVKTVMHSIPVDALKAVDGSREKADTLLMGSYTPDLNFAIQFVYFFSIFSAARSANLTGYLLRDAGLQAGGTLGLMASEGIDKGKWQMAEWAGTRMSDIGLSIRDFYLANLGSMFSGIALSHQGKFMPAHIALSTGLRFLPQAEAQYANDRSALDALHHWATVARHALGEVEKDPSVRAILKR